MGVATLPFVKMEGLGNDYVFVDAVGGPVPEGDLARLAREVADRHFGVGGDGLILVLRGAEAPFRMRIFNADGSEGEMCGNGIRCVAKLLRDRGYVREGVIAVETGAGIIRTEVVEERGNEATVRVDMGVPRLEARAIPVAGPAPELPVVEWPVEAGGRTWRVTCVSMGNPHAVVFVEGWEEVSVERDGPLLEEHPAFPRRTNVEFARVAAPGFIEMRVWERGSGRTLACGTGACATLVAAVLTGRGERRATLRLEGGDLRVEWAEDGRVWMTGPAREVFAGNYPRR